MLILSVSIYGDDNEIYIDQSGDTSNIDLEQLGSGNIIGGLDSTAGSLTPLDLDGDSLNLILNQRCNLNSSVTHPVRKAPLVIIPGKDSAKFSFNYLSLGYIKN